MITRKKNDLKSIFKKGSLYGSRLTLMVLLSALVLIAGVFAQSAYAGPAYDVTIGSGASSNGAWSGGSPDTFTPTAVGATVSATEIVTRLNAGTPVIIHTSAAASGNGDIFLNNALSWSANSTLTFQANRNITINANISAIGNTAGLVLTPNTGGGGGSYTLNTGMTITLSGTTPSLTIAGNAYTVINSLGAAGSATGTDLQGMSGNLAGRYALGSDIDATTTSAWNSGAGFMPIGDSTTNFTGAFDGLGHTITALTVNRPVTNYIGLFGYCECGNFSQYRDGRWRHNRRSSVGGLVGWSNSGGTVSNSYNTGTVTGYKYGDGVGGLVGYNNGGAPISYSYATGAVTGGGDVGGLVGYNNSGSITKSYSTGNVSGTGNFVGGLVGNTIGTSISYSYATGSVTAGNGSNYAGGLAGNSQGSISYSYATGNVTMGGTFASTYAGGLAGASNQNITYSYATGNVTGVGAGSTRIGGLVGDTYQGIYDCYSSGSVTGGANVGGLVGISSGSVTSSYWDTQTSGWATSAGGTGLTTSQMKQQADFTGWDFTNIWLIVEGVSYPTLDAFWVPVPDTVAPTVSSISPANSAIDVAVNTTIVITFSEAMDASTITTTNDNSSNLKVYDPSDNFVPGSWAYDAVNHIATFTPTSDLLYASNYWGSVQGVKDVAGNQIASTFSWSFTTGIFSDTTPPTVSSVIPVNSATGVAVNAAITATFSEAMDATTITTSTFTLSGGGAVSGAVNYTGTTATFTPTADLAYNTIYTATITTGRNGPGRETRSSRLTPGPLPREAHQIPLRRLSHQPAL